MINIHARVKHLIQRYNTRDPERIIKYLGIDLRYEDIGENTKGFYISLITNKYIVISNKLNEVEKVIVLAHELGHALLHYHRSTCFIREYTLFPRGRIENEANKFAAELLIDEKDIDKYSLENMCTNQIASYFGVSEKLVEYKFSN
ncbi:ImmA/IrrE family metallo-endopeptidase [Clostridium sp. 001]|uniref:ImmA/IrrE family metallo-endopeptidase n=1 Tax=Clostridium sp. 001 TaxID=1970093 RepID=UPI001C2B839D|nr:ImmA/IrrE family metallo-endopeptidase [Clostridium sp. 001]QXE19499.1 ImmA/IrrE family metallo-endopeptidase [Clostridium sp. 001]